MADITLTVAKALTRWMDSEWKPEEADWDALPKAIQDAYLDQSVAAIESVRAFDRSQEPRWVRVNDELESFDLPQGKLYRTSVWIGTGYSVAMNFVPSGSIF